MKVWGLFAGPEWDLVAIFTTLEKAEAAQREYNEKKPWRKACIDEWTLDELNLLV